MAGIRGKLSEATKQKISTSLKGFKHSQTSIIKMRIALTGRKLTDKHRENISKALKGNKYSLGFKHPPEFLQKQSILKMGNKNCIGKQNRIGSQCSEITRKKISESKRGNKCTTETRKKMSLAQSGFKGSNWKGGITVENKKIRASIEYRLWREAIFARDGFVCQKCKEKNIYLHPHHILNFADYPELRFAIDNGITFCRECHKQYHHIYGSKNNKDWQVAAFLNKNSLLMIVGE